MTLKEQYWQNGNIFELSTGEKRFVWNDSLMNNHGFIPKGFFNDNLLNTDSTVGECVIRVYSPNKRAGYFEDLLKIKPDNLLWQKSDYIFSMEEIKEKLNIPDDKELIIIKRK